MSRSPGSRGLGAVTSSGSSLRASVLGALNLACGAFENIEQIWVVGSQQIPPVIVPRCPSKFTGPGWDCTRGEPWPAVPERVLGSPARESPGLLALDAACGLSPPQLTVSGDWRRQPWSAVAPSSSVSIDFRISGKKLPEPGGEPSSVPPQ